MTKPLYLVFKPPVESTSTKKTKKQKKAHIIHDDNDDDTTPPGTRVEEDCQYALCQVVGQEPQKFKIRKAKKSFKDFRQLITIKAIATTNDDNENDDDGNVHSDSFHDFKTG